MHQLQPAPPRSVPSPGRGLETTKGHLLTMLARLIGARHCRDRHVQSPLDHVFLRAVSSKYSQSMTLDPSP